MNRVKFRKPTEEELANPQLGTYIDLQTGGQQPELTSKSLIATNARGEDLNAYRIFKTDDGELDYLDGQSSPSYPFKLQESIEYLPYHDTFRHYNVNQYVYNTDNEEKYGKVVSPEDAQRWNLPYTYQKTLIGDDNWTDPSENFLNDLMAAGAGAFKAYGPKLLYQTGKQLKYWLPRLSFQSAYPNAAWAPWADMAMVAIPTGLALNDIYQNGPNPTNVSEAALGLVPVAGEAYKGIKTGLNYVNKSLSSDAPFKGVRLGNYYYKVDPNSMSMGIPSVIRTKADRPMFESFRKFLQRARRGPITTDTDPSLKEYMKWADNYALDKYGSSLSDKQLEGIYPDHVDPRITHESNKNLSKILSKYNITEENGQFYMGNKLLSEEEAQILKSAPVYYDWAVSQGLNPADKNIAQLFIKKQGTSTRGVYAKNMEDAQKFIGEANENLGKTAGDRFDARTGIYTSNTDQIGIHYGENDDPSLKIFKGITGYNYNIDPNLPVLEQLEELSMKDILYDKFPRKLDFPEFEAPVTTAAYRLNGTGVESFSTRYKNYSGKTFPASEKVFFSSTPLKKVTYFGHKPVGPQRDWYKFGVDPDEHYFIRFMADTPKVRDHYRKLVKPLYNQKMWNEDVWQESLQRQYRAYEVEDAYARIANRYNQMKKGAILLGGGLGLGGAGLGYYYSTRPDSENSQSENDLSIYDEVYGTPEGGTQAVEADDLNIYDDLENLN